MMDFCDVTLRVLYDFEYTTKYGRNIKITSGERLYLIKKTNDDWWQVIRSSEERPFFVPASYVEEVETNHHVYTRNQSNTKSSLENKYSDVSSPSSLPKDTLRSSSSSITLNEDIDSKSSVTYTEGRCSSTNQKRENTNVLKHKTLSNTMSSSGYNSLCEEIQALEDETSLNEINSENKTQTNSCFQNTNSQSVGSPNKVHATIKSNVDKRHDATDNSPSSDKELSVNVSTSCSTSNSENSENKSCKAIEGGNYSSAINPKSQNTGVIGHVMIPGLPASDSLENLSLQIELKTSCIRNTVDTKNKSSNVSVNKSVYCNVPSNIVYDNKISSNDCNLVDKQEVDKILKTKILTPSSHIHVSGDNNQIGYQIPIDNKYLQSSGSFSKVESEKQFSLSKSGSVQSLKNVYNSDLGNNEMKVSKCLLEKKSASTNIDSSNEKCNVNNEVTCAIANNSQTVISNKIDEVLQKSEFQEKMLQNRQYFGSDSQLSHLKSAKEKTTSRHSLDSVVETELRESSSYDTKNNSKDSSLISIISGRTNSEKSSNDSLLDIEVDGNFRKISGGTSDSLVPTDGEDLMTTDSETDSVKLAKSKLEGSKIGSKARKLPLTRRRRVFASKSRLDLGLEPPSPEPNQLPVKVLGEGWNEYNTQDGRKFFYNVDTREKRWKPPRRTHNTNANSPATVSNIEETRDENDGEEMDDMFVVNMSLPAGWSSEIDPGSGQTCYIHIASGAKWFSSTDSEGRVYFFEENSNKSSWTLPDTCVITNDEVSFGKTTRTGETNSVPHSTSSEKSLSRSVKSRSMILANRFEESTSFSNLSQHWPQLWEGTMCVLKEGPLNKTKITENGKRVRKNWTSTYAVLTELLLLFFKDNKGFPSMMNGSGRPELSVDLNGAVIDSGDKVSGRKNVYMLSTVLGLQVLIQCDCSTSAQQWLSAIQSAINNLPLSSEPKSSKPKPESPIEDSKVNVRIGRSKSMKLKNKSASIEDLSVNVAERQTKIKERLKKFFHRRPTVELLVKKGIWKDEPVFGCLLEHACPLEPPRVPLFVQHCIRCIEQSEENMKTDGLYRASGNLSQVQKIRLQVDQNIYSLLEHEEDVHVLAGTLKLFFRELKQPLIPFKLFNKALRASTNANHAEKIKDFQDIVKSLPPCNHDTLKFLLQHLLRVTQYHEFNRMHIPNIAIVFGPTLMWPEQESQNMAFDMMQQNLVIECFLSEFHNIFR